MFVGKKLVTIWLQIQKLPLYLVNGSPSFLLRTDDLPRRQFKSYLEEHTNSMAYDITYRVHTYCKFFVPNIVAACLIIVVNSLLIHAVRVRRKRRIISFKLIYILSIADVCSGIAIICESVTMCVISSEENYKIPWNVASVARVSQGIFAMFMIKLLAVDRYLQMSRVNNHMLVMSQGKVNISVVLCAVLTTCLAALISVSYFYDFYAELIQMLCITGLFGIASVLVLYYRAVRSVTIRIQHDCSVTNLNPRSSARELSIAIFVVLACLLLTIAPYFIFNIIAMHPSSQKWTILALYASYLVFNMNSALNAIAIFCFSQDLRTYIRQLLTCHGNSL